MSGTSTTLVRYVPRGARARGRYLQPGSLVLTPNVDSPETSVGVPIGLQLVAPRYEDERLMAALKVVERALQLPP